jgi:hypothetical protein
MWPTPTPSEATPRMNSTAAATLSLWRWVSQSAVVLESSCERPWSTQGAQEAALSFY